MKNFLMFVLVAGLLFGCGSLPRTIPEKDQQVYNNFVFPLQEKSDLATVYFVPKETPLSSNKYAMRFGFGLEQELIVGEYTGVQVPPGHYSIIPNRDCRMALPPVRTNGLITYPNPENKKSRNILPVESFSMANAVRANLEASKVYIATGYASCFPTGADAEMFDLQKSPTAKYLLLNKQFVKIKTISEFLQEMTKQKTKSP